MREIPTATKNLLILNIVFWVVSAVLQRFGFDAHSIFGLHFFLASDFKIFQLFTYMFMHDGFQHIFFNMFAVYMFGSVMERTWGENRFLLFYIICGVGAGLMQELVQYVHYLIVLSDYTNVNVQGVIMPMKEYLNHLTTVGASGAVFGILLGFGLTYPNQPMFIIPFPFPIKAKWLVIGYGALELILGLSGRPGDNVAHFAHLGGMLFGYIVMWYWKKKGYYF